MLPDSSADAVARLSQQQVRLLRLVSSGITASKSLARETGLQPASIDTYLHEAARILGRANRVATAKRLAELEALSSQSSSQLRTSRLVGSSKSIFFPLAVAVRRFLFGLPLGGAQHTFSWSRIGLQILRVGVIGMVGLTALVLFVLGFLKTFG